MEPPSTESLATDRQTFTAFYEAYAPKLWGLIVEAQLPKAQAEAILTNTLIKAWQQLDQNRLVDKQGLMQLIGLACREGLPIKYVQTILTSTL